MFDTSCDTIRDHIDAFLDGELDAGERAVLEAHCTRCHACAEDLRLTVRMRDELRELPPLTAPWHVIDAAERAALGRSNVVALPVRRVRRRLIPAMAAALALAAAAAWFVSDRRATPVPAYSAAEIRRASEEVALAFAYVDKYSGQTAHLVRDDVMGRRVMPRIERALVESGDAVIHDALMPGLKRAARKSGLNVTSPAPERS